MIKEKFILLTLGIILGLLSVFGRLILFGYIFFIGAFIIIVFSVLHLTFLIKLHLYYNKEKPFHQKIAWLGVLSFPMIFLFQFDLHETIGRVYVFEFLTGKLESNFESYAFYIAIAFALIYLINFVFLILKYKK